MGAGVVEGVAVGRGGEYEVGTPVCDRQGASVIGNDGGRGGARCGLPSQNERGHLPLHLGEPTTEDCADIRRSRVLPIMVAGVDEVTGVGHARARRDERGERDKEEITDCVVNVRAPDAPFQHRQISGDAR